MKSQLCLAWGLVVGLMAVPAAAEVKLPGVLSSHMVLQRDMQVPIWGTAAPDEAIEVKFRDQQKTTKADNTGKWAIKLDPLKAGGPDALTVKGTNTVTLEDVLVGEVWVGSGQSNMAGGVDGYVKQGDEVLGKMAAAAPYAKIRLISGGARGTWREATGANVNGFSALLFSFGVNLQKELDVPVGLMQGAVGGTPSGYWLSEEALAADAATQEVIQKFAKTYPAEALQKQHEQQLARWKEQVELAKKENKDPPRQPAPPLQPGKTGGPKVGNLYEAHIRPFIPFGIRGVLWDQGESGTAIGGVDQHTLMGALIRGWRKEWDQGEFAFLYVQKPSGDGCAWDDMNPTTAMAEKFSPLPAQVPGDGAYRETHIRIMGYPKTAMVTSTDLGHGIHPANKSGYGERASRVALGMTYNRPLEIYGPVYKSQQVEGGKIRLAFDHVGQGLAFKHGDKLQGFAIAGKDRVFHWADAEIDSQNVIVSSAKVAEPVAVRYAWSHRHPWANLFNKDGLPALTFRTDEW
jgi:sialate O-acetylesterase